MEKILIHSYKGGTGKTSVALNMAALLASKFRVLVIENDFMMPSFFAIFNHEPNLYFNDYLNGTANFNDIIVTNMRPNLDVIFANKIFDPNEKVMSSNQSWFMDTLERLMKDINNLEGKYDYIIYDTPPGWHMIVINLIMLSTKAILILRPSSYAVSGTKRMIEILYKRAKPVKTWDINLLFNQIPKVKMESDINKWVQEFQKEGIKYAGQIACSCETSYRMAHEATIFPADHEFNRSLLVAMNKVLGL